MRTLLLGAVIFAGFVFAVPEKADAFFGLFRRRAVVVNRVVVPHRQFVAVRAPFVRVRTVTPVNAFVQSGVQVRAPFVRINTGSSFRSQRVRTFSGFSGGFAPVQRVVVPARGSCSAFFAY